MKSKIVVLIFMFYSLSGFALVASPEGNVGESEGTLWSWDWVSLVERGKIEPNENRASFQAAQIDVHQIGLSRHFGDSWGASSFARLELKTFTSGEEAVDGRVFYPADSGYAATVGFGANFLEEERARAGFYVTLTPFKSLNEEKFSIPRIDLWSLSFNLSVQWGQRYSMSESLHYGSGLSGQQNSYVSFKHLFGVRFDSLEWARLRFEAGPYVEMDTSERFDEKYDAVFSPSGNRDRIRSAKFGTIIGVDAHFSNDYRMGVMFVQKLGGYDAPATNGLLLSLAGSLF